MNQRLTTTFAVAAVLAAVLPGRAETPVQMTDLPPAVQEVVKAQSRGATMHGLSKDVEGGRTRYEIELVVDGHSRDVTVDASGAVSEIEEDVALESVPAPAKAVFEKIAGKGTIRKVESITERRGVIAYEASVERAGGGGFEMRVKPDGQVVYRNHRLGD